MLTIDKYSQYKNWMVKYPTNEVKLKFGHIDPSWKPMLKELKHLLCDVNKQLSECMKEWSEKEVPLVMFPYPTLVFNAFTLSSLDDLRVVILGQDPYFGYETHQGKIIPQAMGLSFSVPVGIEIPSSLRNVYSNLLKYKHISKMPTHGNLEAWTQQGCLLLNTSLTVLCGSAYKNCHQYVWSDFTDGVIEYISTKCKHIVFILWGLNAYEKIQLIDRTNHVAIISSHPSGLSANRPLRQYPPFVECDCFGETNKMLKKWDYDAINWEVE